MFLFVFVEFVWVAFTFNVSHLVFKTISKIAHMCGYNKQHVICMFTRNPEASVTQRFILLRPYNLIYFNDIEIPPLHCNDP